ncbi:hypothetical protein PVAND_016511 [Polypedilum vanderplanki]|uniref:Uncharacterized protein n=1 Tax=Polypedilum vanderplanki TaxID=319348 RepID=A0A9J6BGH6_POLVA|nr:hypothetical protein PVAND_016511 [Polypedilum vanderplanki]
MTNTKPVVKADVSIILFKIESSKRRQLFKSQKINFCSALDKETAKGNPMIKVTLGALKDSLTKLKCPWNGIKMENFTIERKFVEFFPTGEYRANTDIDLYAETGEKDFLKFLMVFVIE